VRAFTPEEIAEVYELRILLETHALRLVIEQITDEQIAELEQLAQRMDSEVEPSRWLDNRQIFYGRLYEIANRVRLSKMIANLRAEIGRYWMTVRVIDDPQGHRELIEAIRERNADAAAEWLRGHLLAVCERIQQLIQEQGTVEG
jgi:DNA-binding GntR family transcriptional regulator